MQLLHSAYWDCPVDFPLEQNRGSVIHLAVKVIFSHGTQLGTKFLQKCIDSTINMFCATILRSRKKIKIIVYKIILWVFSYSGTTSFVIIKIIIINNISIFGIVLTEILHLWVRDQVSHFYLKQRAPFGRYLHFLAELISEKFVLLT